MSKETDSLIEKAIYGVENNYSPEYMKTLGVIAIASAVKDLAEAVRAQKA